MCKFHKLLTLLHPFLVVDWAFISTVNSQSGNKYSSQRLTLIWTIHPFNANYVNTWNQLSHANEILQVKRHILHKTTSLPVHANTHTQLQSIQSFFLHSITSCIALPKLTTGYPATQLHTDSTQPHTAQYWMPPLQPKDGTGLTRHRSTSCVMGRGESV